MRSRERGKMEEKIIFREMLSELRAEAEKQGNRLTKAAIKKFFAHAGLNEEQLQLVYEYLVSQKVIVEGYQSPEIKEKEETGEADKIEETGDFEPAADHIELYEEEIREIPILSEEEELLLLRQVVSGETAAKARLVEHYLQMVYEVAQTYQMSELPIADLIQEGNIALLLEMDKLEAKVTLADYRKHIYEMIAAAMETAIAEMQDTREMDEGVAKRANHLKEAVWNLEQDLGHRVSAEELSVYLEMSEKEIHDILRMAGDEIDITEAKED